MQSVQRHFGRFMKRSADDSTVSVLLTDFENADQLLTKIIEASRAWRDSWTSILTYQHRLFSELETLYQPILGAGDDYSGHHPVVTPEKTIARTNRITRECEDLKRDLSDELGLVEPRMIKPAQDAKDSLQMLRKTIKKREDKKLDFERYQGRVDTALKKTKRTDRDNAALVKSQSDLAVATEAYNAADEHLRNCLPPLLNSVFSLLPHLLAAQIQIQNTLLAHYYTVLHSYCTEEGFPSPSPPMDEVIRIWEDKFKPIQNEVENLPMLASGKAVRMPMNLENGHPHTNGYRRPSTHSTLSRGHSVSPARALPPSPSYDAKPKYSTSPSYEVTSKPKIGSSPAPSSTNLLSPNESIVTSPPSSAYQTPLAFSPAGHNVDYFSRDRQSSSTSLNHAANNASSIAAAIQKKRPPPPPPRTPSSQNIHFVTALYDFAGQGEGDLKFKEGDRIKVLKKTESTDDWWQGELRGVKGAFPANYCE